MIIKRLYFLKILLLLLSLGALAQSQKPVNILLITADDLGYEAVGTFGRNIPELTPRLDKFAAEGVQFRQAHTNTPICMPSRSVMATGLYGVSSGMMGFVHMKRRVPTVMQTFQDSGYLTGILGKVSHSTPDMDFKWDFVHDYSELGSGRSPHKYAAYCKTFFELCKSEGKPFYLMVNSHDPHRPFHDPDKPMLKGEEHPSKIFSVDEVDVPGYLPDIPQVRYELSCYYNSVRRLDDTFGMIIKELKASGLYDNTLIVMLSDNGSPFPFAKANTYLCSTRTPFLVHWPGKMKSGLVDDKHVIAEVDLFATFLDVAGINIHQKLDGRSIVPLIKGEEQSERDYFFGEIDYKIGGKATPMRAVGDRQYRYIYNAWSNKVATYKNNNEGQIIKVIEKEGDQELLEWVKRYRFRQPEELYDIVNDPDAKINLIDNPEYRDITKRLQSVLRNWMVEKGDVALTMFDNRYNQEFVDKYLESDFPSKRSMMPEAQLREIEQKRAAKAAKKKK